MMQFHTFAFNYKPKFFWTLQVSGFLTAVMMHVLNYFLLDAFSKNGTYVSSYF